MKAHHYHPPAPQPLTDGERDVIAEHRADQYYACSDCLTDHLLPEAGGDDDECYEYHLLLADAEDRAEARHEERNW
jgi:hypothetical protein